MINLCQSSMVDSSCPILIMVIRVKEMLYGNRFSKNIYAKLSIKFIMSKFFTLFFPFYSLKLDLTEIYKGL